ncbi:olfactory receptor 2T29-like [Phascolarctos cinereus]|uniref:Olfactory receptor n=1 Tax=Phascolarctos cinereus TaxID=38626 RepID=A0A6P5ILN1_PHACI|nr:olfactory receptor 2T29-like [Phascolarctos cinereus]
MKQTMWLENQTFGANFILLGLFSQSNYPTLFYSLTFIIFIVALTGNATLVFLIQSDPHLHTAMCFMSQLSLMDMMYICVTVPKMLLDQVTGIHNISVPSCGIQMFLHLTLVGAEFFLLAAMSYDRYVAICHPLHYHIFMNHRVCILFAIVCWFLGSIDGFTLTPITMNFLFCKSRQIQHFFCEVFALLKISCSDISLYEAVMYVCCVLMLFLPLTVILSSYSLILLTVYRMNSATGRRKAFVTCSSHITVVVLFYGVAVYNYVLPASYHTTEKDMIVSVFYTILTPVINPLIYSIRNKDVTAALKKILWSKLILANFQK